MYNKFRVLKSTKNILNGEDKIIESEHEIKHKKNIFSLHSNAYEIEYEEKLFDRHTYISKDKKIIEENKLDEEKDYDRNSTYEKKAEIKSENNSKIFHSIENNEKNRSYSKLK
jgi:hypothetical protein